MEIPPPVLLPPQRGAASVCSAVADMTPAWRAPLSLSAALFDEHLLLATLRAVGDGVISCDRSGCISLMNAKAEALTGWTEAEALGKPLPGVFRLFEENAPEVSLTDLLLAGRYTPEHTARLSAMGRDGSRFAAELHVSPIPGLDSGPDEPSFAGTVLVFRDVSRARRAESILELLAGAGRVLAEGEDRESILDRISRLATRQFADLVVFDLLDGNGMVVRVAGPARSASQDATVKELGSFVPAPEVICKAFPGAESMRDSIAIPNVDDAALGQITRGDRMQIELCQRLGLHSLLCVPLLSGGERFGIVTFGRTLLPSAYDGEDRVAAEDLGLRIGAALHRARLTPALDAERARLKAILDNLPLGILVADQEGRIVMGNGSVEKITRRQVHPSPGVQEYEEWFAEHPDGRRVRGEEFPLARAVRQGAVIEPEEFLYHRGDQTRGWISVTAAPILDETGAIAGGVAAILDIDAQKSAQEALRASEERSRQILTSTRDCIKVLDLDGALVSMNEEGQQRLGIANFEEVRGRCWLDFWGEDRSGVEAAMAAALAGGAGHFEGHFITAHGESTWWDVTLTPMYDRSGRMSRMLAVSRESTTRKLTELALRQSEERFRRLIEQSSVGVAIGSSGGALSYMNRALLDLLGFPGAEVDRGTVRWDDLAADGQSFWSQATLEALRQGSGCAPYQRLLQARSGAIVPVLVGAAVLGEEGGRLELAVFLTDLTAQKKTETALLESEKLAAVGKLASSISHEINNPLEAVTNLLFILRGGELTPEEARNYLEMADRELHRVSQIVSQTLRFHRQSTRPREVDPSTLLEQVLALYAARFTNYNIHPRCDYGTGVSLLCYEGDLRQVINNLVSNAVDAMRGGGELTLRTRRAREWTGGCEGVRITVADNGTGMTPEVRRRIFEAFFTTKEIHGTGLGLWISSQIVAKHGGTLRVRSIAAGSLHGTVFALWLPLMPAVVPGTPAC